MKRLLIATALVMMATFMAFAQNNNVFWSNRITIKMDKRLEFEKKLPAFLKTHYPQFKFRTYEVLTGTNTGTYVVVFGPFSYKDLDVPPVFPKGEALMKTDEQALSALCESYEVTHFRRQDDIKESNPDRKIKYLEVATNEMHPGQWSRMRELLKDVVEARKLAGSKVDFSIFRPSSSGLNNTYFTVRYFEKMEDLDLQEDLATPYNKVHGTGAWERRVTEYFSLIRNSKIELRVLRGDLSTY